MAAPIVVTTIGPAEEARLSLPASDLLVSSTTGAVDWQAAPNIGGVPQMSIPRSEAFAAFSIRNHTARTPADVAALNPINPLTINLTDVVWAHRILCTWDPTAALSRLIEVQFTHTSSSLFDSRLIDAAASRHDAASTCGTRLSRRLGPASAA